MACSSRTTHIYLKYSSHFKQNLTQTVKKVTLAVSMQSMQNVRNAVQNIINGDSVTRMR